MNPEEYEYLEQQAEMNMQDKIVSDRLAIQSQQQAQARFLEEESRGLVKEQLDLSKEIEKIDHLLRGHIQKVDKFGELIWEEPENNEDVILSENGINFVLNAIQWYLNKNTLLSNYDEDTINRKMKDFATSLADALFMNYGKHFLHPTPEECQNKLKERLQKRKQELIYTAEIKGIEVDEEKIWNRIISEIDPPTERKKIEEQILKDKLKNFDILMRCIQDTVHSAYNRAFMGQERKTLRQHIHVSETMNPFMGKKKNAETGFGLFKR